MDATENPKGAHVVLHRFLRTKSDSVQAVLLCKRTLDAPIHPGYWAFFGGELKDSETSKAAAKREVMEELGVALKVEELIAVCKVKVARASRIFIIEYFSCCLDCDLSKLTLRPHLPDGKVEGEGLGWFSADEIHHLPVRPEDRIAVDTFFREHGT